jgi:hypothetical protein
MKRSFNIPRFLDKMYEEDKRKGKKKLQEKQAFI